MTLCLILSVLHSPLRNGAPIFLRMWRVFNKPDELSARLATSRRSNSTHKENPLKKLGRCLACQGERFSAGSPQGLSLTPSDGAGDLALLRSMPRMSSRAG